MSRRAFDPLRMLHRLVTHDVNFVLIGGVALRMHGSPRVTTDTDVCYERAEGNLERLGAALRSMGAKRVADLYPEGIDADISTEYLAAEEAFAFMTEFGELDLLASPLGTAGFEELRKRSVEVNLSGAAIHIASLDALRDMKRARGSPVDRADLEVLAALDEQSGGAAFLSMGIAEDGRVPARDSEEWIRTRWKERGP